MWTNGKLLNSPKITTTFLKLNKPFENLDYLTAIYSEEGKHGEGDCTKKKKTCFFLIVQQKSPPRQKRHYAKFHPELMFRFKL